MSYPYFDLSTKPVRRTPIPTYSQDPEEAIDRHSFAAFDRLLQERRESRRRIVTAIASRGAVDAPPLVPS